jgi:hypothetical protein
MMERYQLTPTDLNSWLKKVKPEGLIFRQIDRKFTDLGLTVLKISMFVFKTHLRLQYKLLTPIFLQIMANPVQ